MASNLFLIWIDLRVHNTHSLLTITLVNGNKQPSKCTFVVFFYTKGKIWNKTIENSSKNYYINIKHTFDSFKYGFPKGPINPNTPIPYWTMPFYVPNDHHISLGLMRHNTRYIMKPVILWERKVSFDLYLRGVLNDHLNESLTDRQRFQRLSNIEKL